jgi:hypothetical protein
MANAVEHFGYIKQTNSGRYRAVLGTLRDVGEPDGDRLIHTEIESEVMDDLEETQTALTEACSVYDCDMSLEPVKRTGMGVWESMFRKPTTNG